MPAYDYRCQQCQRRSVLRFKTYQEYDTAEKRCPFCGSASVTRLIGRVAVAKSDARRVEGMTDPSAMADLADADPATLGRYMRQASAEVGENLGDEFNEVVGRLERGESPESIESAMPNLGGGDLSSAASDDGGGNGFSDDL